MRSIDALRTWRKTSPNRQGPEADAGEDEILSFPASRLRGWLALQVDVAEDTPVRELTKLGKENKESHEGERKWERKEKRS
jgi:hypothetical protein